MTRAHRGPATGYEFPAKARYRRKFWNAVDRLLPHVPVRKRVVVVLDTADALEVRELLRRRYRPENIHAVNRNPAIIAHCTRTLRDLGLPTVHTHGVDFLQALQQVAQETPVHVANFDACACIGWGDVKTAPLTSWQGYLHQVGAAVTYGGVVGHTFLVGRERGEMATILSEESGGKRVVDRGRSVPKTYLLRLRFALISLSVLYVGRCARHVDEIVYDWYRSAAGHQVMMWFAAKVHPHYPVYGGALMSRVRRRYTDADRVLNLLFPYCLGEDEGVFTSPGEPSMLDYQGAQRLRGPSGKQPIVDEDVSFTPWETGVGGHQVRRV